MPTTSVNTSNKSWRVLVANALSYRVPPFQRDYDWTTDDLENLWRDIEEALAPGSDGSHYMGYLVLKARDPKTFEVVDGQQRLTTLSLLVLAVLAGLRRLADAGVEAENNGRRIEQLRQSFIGYVDPVTLVPRPKLKLNRHNDPLYSDYLVPLRPVPPRGLRLKASDRLLKSAFEFMDERVRARFRDVRQGATLAQFLDELSDRLFFTEISVADEINAFKVFETLNARGVRLSPADLLKNHLFSVVFKEPALDAEIDTLERRWHAMVDDLGGERLPDFVRAHWNSRNELAREGDLFRVVRAATPGRAEVFRLLGELEDDLSVFGALNDPENSYWTEDQRRHVRELRLFGVRQPWPMIMAAARAFDAAGLTTVLRAVAVASFRYNVIDGLGTAEQERAYNAAALGIVRGNLREPSDVVRALASVYVSDAQFKAAFAEKSLKTTGSRNRQVAKYVLQQLEQHLSGAAVDIDSPTVSLEHVLPEKPGPEWDAFPEEQLGDAQYRLGNFALLDSRTSRDVGNLGFEQKRDAYAASLLVTTRRIAERNADWTMDRIAARQREMADQATAVWRLSQLD